MAQTVNSLSNHQYLKICVMNAQCLALIHEPKVTFIYYCPYVQLLLLNTVVVYMHFYRYKSVMFSLSSLLTSGLSVHGFSLSPPVVWTLLVWLVLRTGVRGRWSSGPGSGSGRWTCTGLAGSLSRWRPRS